MNKIANLVEMMKVNGGLMNLFEQALVLQSLECLESREII
jgi:hypothetical protein